MKNQMFKIGALLTLGIALLAATPALAQTNPMRADIPFAFLAGDRMHPAGQYEIRVLGNFRVAELRAVNSSVSYRVLLTGGLKSGAGEADYGELHFNQYGDAYALSGVRAAGDGNAFKVKPSKAEDQMARSGGSVAQTNVRTVR